MGSWERSWRPIPGAVLTIFLVQENHPHDPATCQHRDRREKDKSSRTAEVVIEQEHNPGEPSTALTIGRRIRFTNATQPATNS